ncbi:DUF1007 family protein [Pseudooceanicola onchidii]|uniref:DUF1007 family protein n=1 Tax=Pseudooceanicola onchidii TaxID=2562279 RepID=UPI0010AB410A|nr:DUF1007 family protein [Pseudooceanicola onchidii]
MRAFLRLSTLCLALTAPVGLAAHPHVFVDTGLTLIFDSHGQVTGVEVTWKYDDLYSLLILQDMGLDDDGDGVLTEAEKPQIDGWDMQWMEGYEGDLYLTDATGQPVALAAPVPLSTDTQDARLVSRHRRDLVTPVPAEGLVLRAFDPEFYTAYDLTLGVTLPPPCQAKVTRPDQDTAYREAQDLMSEFPEDAEEVPLLGHVFAETVTITCAPGG